MSVILCYETVQEKKLFAILMLLRALPAKFFRAPCEHKLINLYSENWSEVALTIVPLGLK